MKELSIEEKAQRYDDALERAKEWYNNPNSSSIGKSYLLAVFQQQLEESEDEKIRKSLLEYLHTLPNHYSHNDVCAPEWIAWLEKQGELVNSLSKGLDNAHERIDGLIQKNNSLIEQLEKQGEQKSDTDKDWDDYYQALAEANEELDEEIIQDAIEMEADY